VLLTAGRAKVIHPGGLMVHRLVEGDNCTVCITRHAVRSVF
jgi:hypothetical protein